MEHFKFLDNFLFVGRQLKATVREIVDDTVGILCEWERKATNAKFAEKLTDLLS